jgi:hypothetical protein
MPLRVPSPGSNSRGASRELITERADEPDASSQVGGYSAAFSQEMTKGASALWKRPPRLSGDPSSLIKCAARESIMAANDGWPPFAWVGHARACGRVRSLSCLLGPVKWRQASALELVPTREEAHPSGPGYVLRRCRLVSGHHPMVSRRIRPSIDLHPMLMM